MGGYFGIGVENVSKAMNAGSLFRSAHALGARFVFTVGALYPRREGKLADTSDTPASLPLHEFPDARALTLPRGCELVGIEIVEGAVELPSFRHPRQAAYVLGPERGGLSDAMLARCRHVVRIPTEFSLNLAIAGAIVMYDRLRTLGGFPPRPIMPGGPTEPAPAHVHGGPVIRRHRPKASPPRTGLSNDE